MIQLNVKKKYFFYSLIRALITSFFALPTLIYGIYVLLIAFINHGSINFEFKILLFTSIPVMIVNLFFVVFGHFYKSRLNKSMIYEFYDIISSVKVNRLPKVVYVYTCHGDMYKSRVVQNAKQTYKNVEVWISEGSEKLETIKASENFARQNGFNFFAVGGNGSSNKADNLNAFLQRSGAIFDYLLITDSDEALDSHFVDHAIRCFYWKGFYNLGYVSACNYSYRTQSLFSNIFNNTDNLTFIDDATKNYEFGNMPNLYSASCLVSKKLLDYNNGLFPQGCLEDVYFQRIALCASFSGIILPTVLCGQAFDKNIKAMRNRILRVRDWSIKLLQEKKLSKYNEKYSVWWSGYLRTAYGPYLQLISFSFASIFLWLLVYFNKNYFANILLLVTLIYSLCTLAISFILKYTINLSSRMVGPKRYWIYCCCLLPLFKLSHLPYELYRTSRALFLKKYAEFGGSGQTKKSKSKIAPIKWDLIFLLVFSILLITLTLIYNYVIGWSNPFISLPFFIVAAPIGALILAFISELLWYVFGFINNNKSYNKDDTISIPESKEIQKVKAIFIKNKQNEAKRDLDCLR